MGAIRCELATCLGWTFTEIDDSVTLWDVDDLYHHWRENPPPAVLIRGFLMEKKSKPRRPTRENTRNPFADD